MPNETMKPIVNRSLFFVSTHTLMRDVVLDMRRHMISSVLVVDDHDQVVGIVTERDIVHKFTLLDLSSKLEAPVAALMSRPVRFARVAHLFEDLRHLHTQHGHRHFPVLTGDEPHKGNVVGMVTATDLFRNFLKLEEERRRGVTTKQRLVVNISHPSTESAAMSRLLGAMGAVVTSEPDWRRYVAGLGDHDDSRVLLYDLDGGAVDENAELVRYLKKSTAPVILLTSDARLVAPFRQNLGDGKFIFLKPVDVAYVHWLVTRT